MTSAGAVASEAAVPVRRREKSQLQLETAVDISESEFHAALYKGTFRSSLISTRALDRSTLLPRPSRPSFARLGAELVNARDAARLSILQAGLVLFVDK